MSSRRKYEEYLHSDEWKVKREVALVRAEHACQVCGATQHLEVHHRSYARRGTPAEVNDLTVLCAKCHKRVSKGATPTVDAEIRKSNLLGLRKQLVSEILAAFAVKDREKESRKRIALDAVNRVLWQDHGIGPLNE